MERGPDFLSLVTPFSAVAPAEGRRGRRWRGAGMELRARHHGGLGSPPPPLSANRQHHERRVRVSKTDLSVEGRAHVAKGARACRRFHCTHRKNSVEGRAHCGRLEYRERPDDSDSVGRRTGRRGRRERAGGTRRGTHPHTLLRALRTGSPIPEGRTVCIERKGLHPLRVRLPRRPSQQGRVRPDLFPMLASTALLAGLGLLMVKFAVGKHMLEWKLRRCPRCGRSVEQCGCRPR